MPEQDGLDGADREFEAALRSLSPTASHIDPIAAAFSAGWQSARRQVRIWQYAAVALLMLSTGLYLIPRSAVEDARATRVTSISLTSEPAPVRPSQQSLLMLQAVVRDRGVDAMPPTPLFDVQPIHSNGAL
jgi:hypothetical protein